MAPFSNPQQGEAAAGLPRVDATGIGDARSAYAWHCVGQQRSARYVGAGPHLSAGKPVGSVGTHS